MQNRTCSGISLANYGFILDLLSLCIIQTNFITQAYAREKHFHTVNYKETEITFITEEPWSPSQVGFRR